MGLALITAAPYVPGASLLIHIACMLLLDACLCMFRRILFDTGRLLLIFCAGSVATVIGTLIAFKLLPLASLGSDGWKVT